jgi:uncharacterized protein
VSQRLVDRLFSDEEWEAICRRCGRCCYEKEEGEDGQVVYFDIPCPHLTEDRLCRVYEERVEVEPACNLVNATVVREGLILPPSCAYMQLYEELLDELEASLLAERRKSR